MRLYHGTAGAHVERIRRNGFRPSRLGRAYFTDNLEIATCYAEWATARSIVEGATGSAVPSHVAAIVTVDVPADAALESDPLMPCLPLPWRTCTMPTGEFSVDCTTSPAHVESIDFYEVTEFKTDAGVRLMVRDLLATYEASKLWSRPDAFAEVFDPGELVAAAAASSPYRGSPIHGAAHWLGVAAAGLRIIELGCPADPAVVFAFAALHDCQRHDDGHDPDHGARASAFAERLAGDVLFLSDDRLSTLRRALIDHDRGFTSDDPTIGACWDADRLNLRRLGIAPDPALLSTEQGRSLADKPFARPSWDGSCRLDICEQIPDARDCDWTWVVYRFHLAGLLKPWTMPNLATAETVAI